MAIQVTAPARIAFSLNPIVWKFEADGEGITGGSTAQDLIVFTGAVPVGTLLPVRWNGNQQQLRAVASPADYGGEFPAGDGGTAYVASLVSWFQNNYYFNEDFEVSTTVYQTFPALQFQSKQAGKAYNFSPTNFAGGYTLTDVEGVDSSSPVQASVLVEVWVKKGLALGYERVYRSPLALDGLRVATLDVSTILHAELLPDMPSMVLPTGGFVHDSRLDYYIKYAPAGGENFSVGQLTQSDVYTALLGGTSYEAGSDATVENRLLGLSEEQDRFLSLLGPTRYVFRDQPSFLSFINLREETRAEATLLVTVHYSDETTAEIELAGVVNLHTYQKAQWGVGYNQLNLAHPTKIVSHYTARLIDENDALISEEITYVVRYEHRPYLRYFAYTNSLGAPETLCTYGKGSPEVQFFKEQAEQVLPYAYAREDGQYLEWDHAIQESLDAASGWISEREYLSFRDMFRSGKKFRIVGAETYPINIQTSSIKEGKDGSNTHAVGFSYQYAFQNKAVSQGDLEKEHRVNVLTPPPGLLAAGSIALPGLGVPNTGIVDGFPMVSSPNLVTSGGVYEALSYKQDKLTLGTTAQYLRGDGSLADFATAVNAVVTSPDVPTYAKSLTSKEKVLSDIKTIDGLNSGLDADLWRGQTPGQMTVWKSLQWAAAITLSLSGAVTGSAQIDGSGNVNVVTTLTAPGLSGTANRVAKFNPAGNNVIDSAITEIGGNVGIGTISPGVPLDIVGNTRISYGTLQVFSPDGYGRVYGKNQLSGNPVTAMLIGSGYGNATLLEIGGGTSQGEAVSGIRFRLGTAGTLGAGNLVGTWNATGLGINVSAPTETLHVGGNIRGGVLKLAATAGTVPIELAANSTLIPYLNADKLDGWDGAYYTDASNLNAGIFPIQRHPLSGVAAATYSLVTVNSYGHVTGGSNPTTLAGYGITDAVSSGGSYVNPAWLVSIPASKVTGLPTVPTVGGTVGYLPKFTGASSLGNSLLYDTGTRIGIGTPNPQATLHVLGDMWVRNADASYLSFASTLADGARIDFNNTTSLEFWYNGVTRVMRLTDQARVGINTNAPTETLHVGGSVRMAYLKSDVPQGFAPFVIQSTTEVAKLNAQYHGGYLASAMARLTESATIQGAWTFNTVAPTSTVANNVANDFELATVGFVKSYTTEGSGGGSISDPTPSWVNAITATQISHWDTAYSWGNHNTAGYQSLSAFNAAIAGYQPLHPRLTNIGALGLGFWARTIGDSLAARTMLAGIGIVVVSGNGSEGDPIISLADLHGGFTVNGITVNPRGQVVAIQTLTYAGHIAPLLPPSVLHDSRPPQFSAIPALSATAGTAYNFTINLATYKTSYHNTNNMQIKVVLSKPTWLVTALNGLQAMLTGTPPTSGNFQLVLTVVDDNGNETTLPVDGHVDEPGDTGSQPVTITAKLFDMATGQSVDIVDGGTYTWHPRFNIRFDSVGTHSQVSQSLTGAGGGTFAWPASNALPNGQPGNAPSSQHWVFGPNGDGSVGGWTPGAYSLSPKAYLAGVVKAQPVLNFTLVEAQSGGSNTPTTTAYLYNDTANTVVGQVTQGQTYALPPTWDFQYRQNHTDADRIEFELSKAGANNPVFTNFAELTPFAESTSYLFNGAQAADQTNTDFEFPGTPFGAGTYTVKVYVKKNNAVFRTDTFTYTLAAGGGTGGEAAFRNGYQVGITTPEGDTENNRQAQEDGVAYGYNCPGIFVNFNDYITEQKWALSNWEPYDHTVAPVNTGHDLDRIVHEAWASGQKIRLMIPINTQWNLLAGNGPNQGHMYGPAAAHMRVDGSTPTFQYSPGRIVNYFVPSLARPEVEAFAVQLQFRIMRRYLAAFNDFTIASICHGYDNNAEGQGPIQMANSTGPDSINSPRPQGDFNQAAISRFKALFPQYTGATNAQLAASLDSLSTSAMGRAFWWHEADLPRKVEWSAIAYAKANLPGLTRTSFQMAEAGSYGDGLTFWRRTANIQARTANPGYLIVKANDESTYKNGVDLLLSAALANNLVAYYEPSPDGGDFTAKAAEVRNACIRAKEAGISISLLTQGHENQGVTYSIAQQAGIIGVAPRPVLAPGRMATVSVNLSAVLAGNFHDYFGAQMNPLRTGSVEFVRVIINDDINPGI